MTRHIRLITPHTTPRPHKCAEFGDLLAPFRFSHVNIEAGPPCIESLHDEVMCTPGVIASARQAETDGVDAIIIDCVGDPGMHGTREAVSIPVIGPGEAGMHLAASLGHRFGVVTISDRVRPLLERNALLYGLRDKLASVQAVEIGVLDIEHSGDSLLPRLLDGAVHAIERDRADAILLGCTGFLGLSAKLSAALVARGTPVPVVSPLQAALMAAQTCLSLGLSHSRRAYPPPPRR
jgi:allantoin racemase